MGILNRKNAKQEREQRKDAAPADDFKDMDDLGSDNPRYGGEVEAGAHVQGESTPIPPNHPAYSPDEVVEPGATRAELRRNAEHEALKAAQPEPERYATADPNRVKGLSKTYLAGAIDSLKRTPNLALSDQFRARLETYRVMVTELVRSGVKGEANIVVNVVSALALDGAGKVDAIVFLRQLMGQVLWQSSVQVARLRRPLRERDDQREPPMGMADMSDHSDAIQGMAGPDTNPNRVITEDDVFAAVMDVHGFLSTVADQLPDSDEEREYMRLDAGLSFCDERVDDPAMPNGVRWEPVFDLDKAMDLQLVKNAEALKAKEQRNAERRAAQLRALGKLYA